MLRHLPPAAAPVNLADLRAAFASPTTAPTKFQSTLTQYLGVQHVHLASSGRTALYLILKSLIEVAGDSARRRILLPAYTCPAVAKVILDTGLRPHLIDLCPKTLSLNMDQLRQTLADDVLAVICVHPFGIPQPINDLRTLADQYGVVVIEDAAQALGARLNNKHVGTIADFGLYSLGPGKALSTGGGGVLAINNTRYVAAIQRIWQQTIPPIRYSVGALSRVGILGLMFHPLNWWMATRMRLHRLGSHEASWGYAMRGLSQSQAAIGNHMLAQLDSVNEQRKANAEQLIHRLQDLDAVHIFPAADSSEPIYIRLPLLVDTPERRNLLFQHLWAANIGVGKMYEHPISHFFPTMETEPIPGATQIASQLLTLPTHHYLTKPDIDRIVAIVKTVAN